MATYHSTSPAGAGASEAVSPAGCAGCSGAASGAGAGAPPPPKTLSKARPSSASRPVSAAREAPSEGAGGAGWAWGAGSTTGAAPAAGRTSTTCPHRLQRTLTPPGPTLSSEIMYCAPQLSQLNRIVRLLPYHHREAEVGAQGAPVLGETELHQVA
jgi:hypothetical protein